MVKFHAKPNLKSSVSSLWTFQEDTQGRIGAKNVWKEIRRFIVTHCITFQAHPVGIRLDSFDGAPQLLPGRYLLPHLRLMIIDPSLFFYSAFVCTLALVDRILATCNESSTRQALAEVRDGAISRERISGPYRGSWLSVRGVNQTM